MQGRVGVVLGEAALSGGIVPGHRHVVVLGDADIHRLSPNHELIQMLAGDFGHPSVRHLNQGRVLCEEWKNRQSPSPNGPWF